MSPAEARSLGCRFDPMSFSWLAPSCFDQVLTSQFLDVEDWHWYLDDAKQHEADRTAVLSDQYEGLFVDIRYHWQHCAFMWRKLRRAILSTGVINGFVGSYKHSDHCAEALLQYE